MPVHILHLHSAFDLGGKEARAVRLMNAFGDAARHTIVSGVPDALSARDAIAPGIKYEIAQDPPPLTGRPSVKRFEALTRYMRRFDLILTYNWGAVDAVMARCTFTKGMPPLIHHEDGFNADEADHLKVERNMYRRIALGAAAALVVPSDLLERIAIQYWKQPAAKLHRIPNGIPTALYAVKPDPRAIPGFRRKPGELVVGSLAGLRAVKNLPMLLRACAGVPGKLRIVIVGEGPERAAIESAAALLGLGDRVHLPGFLPEPHRFVGLFDIFALSSKSEQFPISVIEAMAAGLPVAAPSVGDVGQMVAEANWPYIAPHVDAVELRDMITMLARDKAVRKTVGAHNQAKAQATFDEDVMIARYAALYAGAIGRPGVFG
ncbi:glycosyltransferase involved in cell wall biosynthesis [Hephaestia caeni]|uniref:Glycosyltransferase involved in cell wall biosynthesis n=1 Tax=Hephaestia caeni TaxID=645617 RepID=A0A397PBQ8_9SPHN|nr:glycosyltransferase family 4 protein [Hephaestia caeni]RIA47016.1 glycosyltransferase involved in cell wall biosynthesis [Hephaestia caeni]